MNILQDFQPVPIKKKKLIKIRKFKNKRSILNQTEQMMDRRGTPLRKKKMKKKK
jgi:hypothetical protein